MPFDFKPAPQAAAHQFEHHHAKKLNQGHSYILSFLTAPNLLRASFAGAQRGVKLPIRRIAIRPVDLHQGRRLQISSNDGRKGLSTNHTPEELPAALADILAAGFANIHITTTTEEIDLRLTKKGKILVARKKSVAPNEIPATHNRAKDVPLPEGRADALLEAMGILDRNHRVRPSMRDKFTQINEFLKLLSHALPGVTEHRQDADATLTILDCGCGSSHLTLATAHYLNDVLKIPARLIGIDANEEVIEKSRARAAKLPQPLLLEFRAARIGEVSDIQADIVLALHACDTATDDALAQAVKSTAKLILAVPCCHKNLNGKLDIPALASIHHHGILHQRQADLITDAFRALLLKLMGYRAEVIEFTSPEHTARNLMIRAVKVHAPGDAAALREYHHFKQFTGVTPYLERVLGSLLPSFAITPQQ
jgi:SAM-dependent methyltransferase